MLLSTLAVEATPPSGTKADASELPGPQLVTKRKPSGLRKRLKRALASEAAWHARMVQQSWRNIRRAMGALCRCGRRAAEAAHTPAGKVFRLVSARAWPNPASSTAPPPRLSLDSLQGHGEHSKAVLLLVNIRFSYWTGRRAAAAVRAAFRDGALLASTEASIATALAAREDVCSTVLGASTDAMCALLDDQPFARLDVSLAPPALRQKGSHQGTDVGLRSYGLDPPVVERLQLLLALCSKEALPAVLEEDEENECARSRASHPAHEPVMCMALTTDFPDLIL
jgi:hypothetical protein